MTNYNDGNWHIWNGGECPVHPETVVEVALTDYTPCTGAADQWFWDRDKSRIIAFRVIKEHKPAREFWLVMSRSGHNVMAAESEELAKQFSQGANGRSIIHVREVLE